MTLSRKLREAMKRRWKRRQPAEAITLIGGPLDRSTALLTRPWGTLELTHEGRRGRYNADGVWEWLP